MILQNEFVPSQNVTPTRKPIFFYLIGLFIFLLVVFISWGSYQIYQYNKYVPGLPPPTPFFDFSPSPYTNSDREGVYVCTADGGCVVYPPQDAKKFCPKTFQVEGCDNQCRDKKNRCSK
jgi:hypothetical protein